jgi:iron(III) transport system ATP-binding protein
MDCSMICLDGVTRRFGDVIAVDGASLCVDRGEVVAILGPSGCGKTTLLRLIAGFERPDAGVVEIDGRTVSTGVVVPPEQRRVGMVFQDYALSHLTVAENVGFGPRRRRRPERVPSSPRPSASRPRPAVPHELSEGSSSASLARAGAVAELCSSTSRGRTSTRSAESLRAEVVEVVRPLGVRSSP